MGILLLKTAGVEIYCGCPTLVFCGLAESAAGMNVGRPTCTSELGYIYTSDCIATDELWDT